MLGALFCCGSMLPRITTGDGERGGGEALPLRRRRDWRSLRKRLVCDSVTA